MRTLSLLRVKVEGTTWLSRGRVARMRRERQFWIVPLAVLGFGTLIVMGLIFLVGNYFAIYQAGRSLGRPELPVISAVFAGWITSLLVSFPLAISVLYFSRDTALLLSLPIAPRRIVTVNYLLLYLYSLPVPLLVMAPAFVIYLVGQGAGAAGIVAATLVALSAPLPALALSVLFVLALTRMVNLSRHRVALEVTGMMLLVAVLIAFQVLVSRSLAGSFSGASPTAAMHSLAGGIVALSRIFPPVEWAAASFGNAVWLIPFVAVGGLLTLGAAAIVQAGYLRRYATRAETGAARRAGTGTEAFRRSSTPTRALLSRELTILSSNSTYLFEALGEVAIFPIVLLIFRFVTPPEVLESAVPLIRSFPFTLPAVLGVLSLMAGFNTVASTAISREGRTANLSLSLPLSGWRQIRGKRACFFLLFVPAFVVNVFIAGVLFELRALDIVLLVIAGLPVINLIFDISIASDLRRPLLEWSHPQQAMKQNMNVLVSMGLVFLTTVVLGVIVALTLLAGAGGRVSVVAAGAAALIAGALLHRPLVRYADARYASSFSRSSEGGPGGR